MAISQEAKDVVKDVNFIYNAIFKNVQKQLRPTNVAGDSEVCDYEIANISLKLFEHAIYQTENRIVNT